MRKNNDPAPFHYEVSKLEINKNMIKYEIRNSKRIKFKVFILEPTIKDMLPKDFGSQSLKFSSR